MSGADIRKGLVGRLTELYPSLILYPGYNVYPAGAGANIPSTLCAWENFPFTPAAGMAWYRATFLPGTPYPTGFGVDAKNRHPGIFQIDCFFPRDAGDGTAIAEAERIITYFKRGTRITCSGVITTCEKAFRLPGYQDPDPQWYAVPVRVQYWADIAN